MTETIYTHEIYPDGYARFASKRFVFVRFRGKWEFYLVRQSGDSRGLEMFAGYVEEPAQIAVLERAVRSAHQMGPLANSILPNHARWPDGPRGALRSP